MTDRAIHVVGSTPDDYRAPQHDHEDQPLRDLSAAEVLRLRRSIENLRDVGWRPFGEAGEAWQAALNWSLDALEVVVSSEPSGDKYWVAAKEAERE